jgi:hypothetical protein
MSGAELGRIIRSTDLLDADETLEGPGIGLLHLTEDDHKVPALAEAILDALYAALREQRAARPRHRATRRK